MTTDPWEQHAGWWQEGFTDGADPEYEEQILPLAAEWLRGAGAVLDVGTGEGQLARLAVKGGARLVVGVDPTWGQLTVARERAGGPVFARAAARRLPCRTGAFDAVLACLVFEHIDDYGEAIAEVARVLRRGGRFLFFLNHPLLQTPASPVRSHWNAAKPARPAPASAGAARARRSACPRRMAATAAQPQARTRTAALGRVAVARPPSVPASTHRRRPRARKQPAARAIMRPSA